MSVIVSYQIVYTTSQSLSYLDEHSKTSVKGYITQINISKKRKIILFLISKTLSSVETGKSYFFSDLGELRFIILPDTQKANSVVVLLLGHTVTVFPSTNLLNKLCLSPPSRR